MASCTVTQLENRITVQLQVNTIVPRQQADAALAATTNATLENSIQEILSDPSPGAKQEVERIVQQTIVEHVALATVKEAAESAALGGQGEGASGIDFRDSAVATAAQILQALPLDSSVVEAVREGLPSVAEINRAYSIAEFVAHGIPLNVSGLPSASAPLADAFAAVPEIGSPGGEVSISPSETAMYFTL